MILCVRIVREPRGWFSSRETLFLFGRHLINQLELSQTEIFANVNSDMNNNTSHKKTALSAASQQIIVYCFSLHQAQGGIRWINVNKPKDIFLPCWRAVVFTWRRRNVAVEDLSEQHTGSLYTEISTVVCGIIKKRRKELYKITRWRKFSPTLQHFWVGFFSVSTRVFWFGGWHKWNKVIVTGVSLSFYLFSSWKPASPSSTGAATNITGRSIIIVSINFL